MFARSSGGREGSGNVAWCSLQSSGSCCCFCQQSRLGNLGRGPLTPVLRPVASSFLKTRAVLLLLTHRVVRGKIIHLNDFTQGLAHSKCPVNLTDFDLLVDEFLCREFLHQRVHGAVLCGLRLGAGRTNAVGMTQPRVCSRPASLF